MAEPVPDPIPGPEAGREASDAEVVAAALGERRAFAPLYARYVEPIYGYCAVRLGSREEAEDATGQTFERAMAGLAGFRGGSFRSWLFAIAANAVRNVARDRKPAGPLPPGWEPEDPDLDASPEAAAMAGEEARWLRALLRTLPPGQRRVTELRLAGLTAPEIAEVLGMSTSAVKVAQWRAFTALRGRLGDGGMAGRRDGDEVAGAGVTDG